MGIIRKHISLAVLGAPSSGKTYLLSDLIQSFGEMGYVLKELPLSTPYNSFGSFFFETTNNVTDGLRQTEVYVCRPENHYGAIFSHPKLPVEVEVDFLNIAGETFGNDANHLGMFFQLKRGIQNIKGKKFAMVRYTNPAGKERFVLEPLRKLIESKEVEYSTEPSAFAINQEYRRGNFLDAGEIYAELKEDGYTRKDSKNINGKTLLKRFFEIVPDSIFSTLLTMWKRLFPGLNRYALDANHIFHYFYPLLYCMRATDIIICDRMFVSSKDERQTLESYPFDRLVSQVCSLVADKNVTPNVYLAFRGADFMLKTKENTYKALIEKMNMHDKHVLRDNLYSLFYVSLMQSLFNEKISLSGTEISELLDEDFNCNDYVNTALNNQTLTGMTLPMHLKTRVGFDLGNGFWHLMNQAEGGGLKKALTRGSNGGKKVKELFHSKERMTIPPHVYFTSTPIDINFNIYDNDKNDVTKFIHKDSKGIKYFHIETACNNVPSMCWGSYQLLDDILTQNGLNILMKKEKGSVLSYIKNK